MPKIYEVPPKIAAMGITQELYERWLRRKAAAHVKRDRKRSNYPITGESYRRAIHRAVQDHGTHDYYTGEVLNWSQISTYNNQSSKEGRSTYKAGLRLMPTVDHVMMDDGTWDFVICAWQTNGAKNDLDYDAFVALCRKVVDHRDRFSGS